MKTRACDGKMNHHRHFVRFRDLYYRPAIRSLNHMNEGTTIVFRPLTLSAALVAAFTFAGPALAASDLAVELKQLARAEQGKVSLALSNISYNDTLYLLDELNHADYRRLSQAMVSGRLHLPRNIRNALEVKAPRLNQRGSGR